MTEHLNNPFVEYGYKGPDTFCDRRQETDELLTFLHNESNVALISPRRMGKTGLIMHTFHHLKEAESNTACIYIDIMNTRNTEQFINLFASKVIGSMDTLSQALWRRVTEFFGSLNPVLSFDELTGSPQLSLTVSPTQQHATIERIFKYIEATGRRCYIAFDEFQQVAEYPEEGIEALLRSHIQFIPNATFVFAGSQQHLMEEMFTSAKRPFYQSSQVMALGCIRPEEYLSFANKFFAAQGRTMSAEVFAYLYDMVDGQTWYVQTVLHRLFELTDCELNEETVRRAFNDKVNSMAVPYTNYYASLTNNQAALIVAIAKERKVEAPLARDFLSRHDLPAASSVSQALKVLEQRQMIYHAPDGYIVYDRFFGMWLRQLP